MGTPGLLGWERKFMDQPYYKENCPVHKAMLQAFCVTCKEAICRDCLTSSVHSGHTMFKVYKCGDNNQLMIRVSEMKGIMDVSRIMTYEGMDGEEYVFFTKANDIRVTTS